MNLQDTIRLLAYLASANVIAALEETAPEVWADGLGDLPPGEVEDAARALVRTSQWVKIKDIRDEVMRLRNDRHEHPSWTDLRTRTAALDTGQMRPALPPGEIGRTIAENPTPIRQLLDVACSWCGARPGMPCETPGVAGVRPHGGAHPARRAAAGHTATPDLPTGALADRVRRDRLTAAIEAGTDAEGRRLHLVEGENAP